MISLFNGFIPLVAIQMQCVELNGVITLLATKVLDLQTLGTDEEDESGGATDREYWTKRRGPASLAVVDRLYELVQIADPSLSLKYNKFYVTLSRLDRPSPTHAAVEICTQGRAVVDRLLLAFASARVVQLTSI